MFDDPAILPLHTSIKTRFGSDDKIAEIVKIDEKLKITVRLKDPPYGSTVFTEDNFPEKIKFVKNEEVYAQKDGEKINCEVTGVEDKSVYYVESGDGAKNTVRRTGLCYKEGMWYEANVWRDIVKKREGRSRKGITSPTKRNEVQDDDHLEASDPSKSDYDSNAAIMNAQREEKDNFLARLMNYHWSRNIELEANPMIKGNVVDLHYLHELAKKRGGVKKVYALNLWSEFCQKLGMVDSEEELKPIFKQYLEPFMTRKTVRQIDLKNDKRKRKGSEEFGEEKKKVKHASSSIATSSSVQSDHMQDQSLLRLSHSRSLEQTIEDESDQFTYWNYTRRIPRGATVKVFDNGSWAKAITLRESDDLACRLMQVMLEVKTDPDQTIALSQETKIHLKRILHTASVVVKFSDIKKKEQYVTLENILVQHQESGRWLFKLMARGGEIDENTFDLIETSAGSIMGIRENIVDLNENDGLNAGGDTNRKVEGLEGEKFDEPETSGAEMENQKGKAGEAASR